jgi:predicted GIY-YIG superfamily endonuclease
MKARETSAKSFGGVTEDFNIRVDVHQESTLSTYLFSVAMDEVTKDEQGKIPWCVMLADDIVLIG